MDLTFLDKASSVTPILVRLYDSHKLYGLAKDKKPLARAELTGAISELLEMDLSPRESELVADVLIALVRQAERDLRQALAERLSLIDRAPLRLILQLANDEIDIAAPVLKNSSVLGDLDLIYIIKAKGPDYWQAIACRNFLSNQVMNVLADTQDFNTAMNLAQNSKITLTEHTLAVLSDIAQRHEPLAQPLLRREEMTTAIAARLYQCVGQEMKQYIIDNYDMDKSFLIETIDEVVLEFVEAADNNDFTPSASTLKAADRFKEKGLLTINLMLGTLKRGQMQSFVAQFSRFSGLEPKTVAEILMQPTGQGLAVACKAFKLMKPDFISIYLLTNRVRNEGKTVDMKELTKALHYYDSITEEIAQGIMSNSRSDQPLN